MLHVSIKCGIAIQVISANLRNTIINLYLTYRIRLFKPVNLVGVGRVCRVLQYPPKHPLRVSYISISNAPLSLNVMLVILILFLLRNSPMNVKLIISYVFSCNFSCCNYIFQRISTTAKTARTILSKYFALL